MRTRILVLAPTFLAATACTGTQPGPDPTATTTTTTGASTTTNPVTVATRPTTPPAVNSTIDLSGVYAKPCALLTTAQQNELGFLPLVEETTEDTMGICHWKQGTDADYSYRLRVYSSADLLTDAYRTSRSVDDDGTPHWLVFEARDIGGLPAVVRSFDETGQCEVLVGVGERQGIAVSGEDFNGDPTLCDRFVRAAELVVAAVS